MMKKVTLILGLVIVPMFSSSLWAQNTLNYQGVLRDTNGKIMSNESIDLRFRLLPDRDQPNVFDFEEEHLDIPTNEFGVFNAIVGSEDPASLSDIDFSKKYFFEVAIRTQNQEVYQMLQRSTLSATPYALHAMTAEDVDDADADPSNEIQTLFFDAATKTLSISGGNEIQIPMGESDADTDPENELQTLSRSGNTIRLSNGGEVQDQIDDADADPENEIQQLTKSGNQIKLSVGGGSVTDAVEDADADPENELQFLDFDSDRNELSISGGNKIELPFGGESDGDSDPENELQHLSLLGNGNLILSNGGGEVFLKQSPLVPTTDTKGRFAYKLNQKLAINKDRPHAETELDVSGIIRASMFQTNYINPPANQQGISQLFIQGLQGRHIASFTGAIGNAESNLYVDELKIGRGTVRLHSQRGFDGEFWVSKVGRSEKLMRIGEKTSAISTEDLFVSDHLHIYHPSHATGQSGLQIYNVNAHNYWNLYTSAANGNLEFWYKGAIKTRLSSSDGSFIRNSDRRLKKEIRPLESVLNTLMDLQPKRYVFKDDESRQENIGFITQEIEKLYPELVRSEGDDNFQGLNYQEFSVLAIKAIQEQQQIIESQADKLCKMDAELKSIKSLLVEITSK